MMAGQAASGVGVGLDRGWKDVHINAMCEQANDKEAVA
jgi:hypothetical protein